jgi:vacuolar-type H+-ATPase subunit I/STV1
MSENHEGDSSNVGEPQGGSEDLQAEIQKLRDTNQRLLKDSKEYKSKAKFASEKLSEFEQSQLEKEGNFEKLLERSRSENNDLISEVKNLREKTIDKELRARVAELAPDAHSIDMVLAVKDHRDLLKVDQESLSVSGVDDYLEAIRENNSYLFKGKKPEATEHRRGNFDEGKLLDSSKMTREERKSAFSNQIKENKQ